MGRKRSAVGEQLSEQISSRSGGLLRKEETGHGSVFRGALADRALNAVGARAMTVDGEVIVSETFDLVSAENQALFAHEKFHQKHSGGAAGQTIRDAEEIAARSVESMVFHQASGGHGCCFGTLENSECCICCSAHVHCRRGACRFAS